MKVIQQKDKFKIDAAVARLQPGQALLLARQAEPSGRAALDGVDSSAQAGVHVWLLEASGQEAMGDWAQSLNGLRLAAFCDCMMDGAMVSFKCDCCGEASQASLREYVDINPLSLIVRKRVADTQADAVDPPASGPPALRSLDTLRLPSEVLTQPQAGLFPQTETNIAAG